MPKDEKTERHPSREIKDEEPEKIKHKNKETPEGRETISVHFASSIDSGRGSPQNYSQALFGTPKGWPKNREKQRFCYGCPRV